MGPQRSRHDARRRLGRSPGWLRDLAGAWVFYSVLPAWPVIAPRFERIARFAPLIGVVLGALQALLWLLSHDWLPVGARVALLMALGLALSGGLHHDGALDTADGLAAGPRALEAMQDSRVGAAAVQAALQLALLRAAGLACLASAAAWLGALALVWACFWGRIAPLLAMHRYPYLRGAPAAGGTAGFHRRHWRGLGREVLPALLAALPLLALSAALTPARLPLLAGLVLAGLPPALLVPWWLGRRLGGHSGDSYGACVEWSEALALLVTGLLWCLAAAE
ncbi:adenosylcobinamide-GDP ribazoletransferase [Cyanobium sp. CH-040]|uniref:adenosylcobinamide-GDP ribazoletransferase n=1 Tax=Cyanobium sp. CH-040 TaxID=2823708 RepID=UPI0020CD1BCD|nr:adenosylcobinamide-GDP ribazoletransferase [Cyanobium sp. CH-040]